MLTKIVILYLYEIGHEKCTSDHGHHDTAHVEEDGGEKSCDHDHKEGHSHEVS